MTFLGRLAATDGVIFGLLMFALLILTFPDDGMEKLFDRFWRPIRIAISLCGIFGLLFIFLKIWGVN